MALHGADLVRAQEAVRGAPFLLPQDAASAAAAINLAIAEWESPPAAPQKPIDHASLQSAVRRAAGDPALVVPQFTSAKTLQGRRRHFGTTILFRALCDAFETCTGRRFTITTDPATGRHTGGALDWCARILDAAGGDVARWARLHPAALPDLIRAAGGHARLIDAVTRTPAPAVRRVRRVNKATI